MKLTTTSYAILGHLALRPWTMYELAAQMRNNVHYFFPRAESQVYAEPKRLVGHGLARVDKESVGRRARTIYSITDAGRAELERWLAERTAKGPTLEFEGLLRVFLAPLSSESALVDALNRIRDDVSEMLEAVDRVGSEYVAGTAPFQRHAMTRSIVYDFLASYAELADDWARRSIARVEAWPELDDEARHEEAMRIFRSHARAARRRRGA